MGPYSSSFLSIALLVPPILVLWYLVSSLNRITRGIEDIAMTLRRLEHNGTRPTRS